MIKKILENFKLKFEVESHIFVASDHRKLIFYF